MLIHLSRIQRLYRSDEVETTALHDIELEIAQGEFVAIMGPSGCGKSTLLNILGTIDRPTAGSYRFGGEELTKLNEAALARFRRENLGYIFQSFNLIDELTIEENIELALVYRNIPKPERRKRVAQAMDRVGIAHRARHYPSQLSGGQQQRAAIARAIVGEPRLILADEPTGNLDTENGTQVMDILQTLNDEGSTIIMVTHSPSHADLARRRVDMLDGQIVISVRNVI
ncbi:antimicrobial peptide ABC transporter ATP-binding protein [Acetobacter tropicalis NRIC 0312]|uniref:ABC transporter ATP-binding protein n=1 Tax=Acetobacter tropicalis TaxID=104102 RepID=A0A0C9LLT1_9PROT|nr:ABC transporter ATP-binding protein [Acetobacter tropicalis]KXV51480.1 phosphonate ABC transporter ATP-binding protein [Acetobacter tropicalis]OUI82727.1 phosphonate ABC transporter ATP-binding protein [Acetobacter tropicalis]GAL98772.1 phosphonate ABC transporter ATP-binding protein [Acetobacter tropicalis]GBR66798.1 antimicrobial peptide ABC transporter ATP-binding protein [Acetobacter tropicalis NRIC 0312]GEL51750.1 ABC transporter ATP-binding protein [Acetobacter tropicalis]